MAKDCPPTTESVIKGSDIFAQQLFLGASINNFSTNLGWGGTTSNLSVDLINDFGSLGACNISNNTNLEIFKIKGGGNYDVDNHYYDCTGNSCYIDEKGFPYDPDRQRTEPDGPDVPQPSKEKRIPGKVYHYISGQGDLVSRYWRKHDPGFFGAGTLIDPNGQFSPRIRTASNGQQVILPYRYNIIGVPAIFRYGYFTFGGIITSWDASVNGIPIGASSFDIFNAAISYRVNLSSADVLLNNCKIILNEYSGSIFCALGSQIGGPTNYTGDKGQYTGLLKNGNIPNVFNVYGFLESFGFGTSNRNDNGIPLTYVLDALTVLTSTSAPLGAKFAFSPFGRIVAPIPLTDAISKDDEYYGKPTNSNFGQNAFGIMNQEIDNTGTPRIRLALDLSEIPRPPLDIRIGAGNPVMSITDLIRQACDRTNRDFYTTIISKDGVNFIKVKTVNRGVVVPVNSIEKTVKNITDSDIPVTQSSFGQTDNRASPRVMLIGANQKRLFQAKSFLLGYSNAHLVYHPVLKKFVDYYRFGKTTTSSSGGTNNNSGSSGANSPGMTGSASTKSTSNSRDTKLTISADKKFVDSVRIPLSYSTRNLRLCTLVNGELVTRIWANEQKLGPDPDARDPGFSDAPVGGTMVPNIGNYNPAAIYKMKSLDDPPRSGSSSSARGSSGGSSSSSNQSGAQSGAQSSSQAAAAYGAEPIGTETPEEAERRAQRQANAAAKKESSGKGKAKQPPNPRYLPLYKYAISPFFGFINDNKIPQGVGPYSNRFVRPVYFDTVTGQIIVLCRGDELPILSFGRLFPLFDKRPSALDTLAEQLPDMEGANEGASNQPANGDIETDDSAPVRPDPPPVTGSPVGRNPFGDTASLRKLLSLPSFGITESEMRAAAQGIDEYLAYCLAKLDFSKPDLFLMLVRAYMLNGKGVYRTPDPTTIDSATRLDQNELGSGVESISGADAGDNAMGAGQTTGNVDTDFSELIAINFNYLVNYEFYDDLTRIQLFIKSLHDEYYGLKYAVSLPAVSIYKDRQYADIQLPVGSDIIGVYQGSGKLFYSYEISSEGAWEEFGNTIDDNIIVGGPNYYPFIEDNNLIQPILGYNATAIKDYATEAWCNLNTDQRDKEMQKAFRLAAPPNLRGDQWTSKRSCSFIKKSFELSALARYFSCDKSITASLDIGAMSDSNTFIVIPVGDSGREDAYGQRLLGNTKDPCGVTPKTVTIPTEKLYIKTSCDDNKIVFYDPLNLALPKAVLSSPGVNLGISSTSFKEDPNRTIKSTVSSEDLAILVYFQKYGAPDDVYKMIASSTEKMNLDPTLQPNDNTINEFKEFGVIDSNCDGPGICFTSYPQLAKALNGESGEDKKGEARLRILKYLLHKQIVPLLDNNFLIPASNSSGQSKTHFMLAPKKANPVFAAVPLQDNISCYGPWTNYPSLDDPSYTFPGITDTSHIIEQLISDTHIDKNESWAPWEWGGMALLDRKMLYEIESLTSFQTRAESGEFSIAGLPIFSMGGNLTIKKTDQDINRRVIKTWFSFPYHALDFAAGYEGLNNYAGLTLSDMRLSVGGGSVSTTYSFRTYEVKRGLYSKENSDRLNHLATNAMSVARGISDVRIAVESSIRKQIADILTKRRAGGKDTDISGYHSKFYGTSPSTIIVGKARHYWPLGNYSANLEKENKNVQTLRWEKSRFDSWAGLFDTKEALNEMSFGYGSQAGMSFDGLYSPISFYPTAKGGTYPVSSRYVTDNDKKRDIKCPGCENAFEIDINGKKFPCPLCQKSKVFPPFDINQSATNTDTDEETAPDINFLSLNPIIMPTGDFINPNAQPKKSGERGRHNISFVLRDETHIVDRNILINRNLTKFKDDNDDPNPDWSDIDVTYKEDNNVKILNNHRFFSFRGPMMLHGWGYDTDGYPVPNAADEPKELDSEGRPKRFFLTSSGTNDLTQDGAFLPTPTKQLGDIIGKGWDKTDGEWTRKPSSKFYLNWGERADLWPVGPIDLRWDYDRKVWVGGGGDGGCNNAEPPYIVASGNSASILSQFISASKKKKKECSYKMIYGILEQNLSKLENNLESFPARAFLDDLEYGLKPLPENIRRLVYIVDRTGYTAPRGAKLLLRYNTDTGFYEPVSKQQYIVYGMVNGNYTATVELNYMPGYKSGDYTYKDTINYRDPLNLETKSSTSTSRRGIFMYDNYGWNLIAIG